MNDLTLLFVPQWSAFQPALALPSLAGWLRREGFRVRCVDANLLFYQYLFTKEAADMLLDMLPHVEMSEKRRRSLRSVFNAQEAFKKDMESLRPSDEWMELSRNRQDLRPLRKGYSAFDFYIKAVSLVLQDIEISPMEFRVGLRAGSTNVSNYEHFADHPMRLFEGYMDWMMKEHLITDEGTRMWGISCIGMSQLPFTLMFGKYIKQYSDAPIVVGGTIFSRIFERNKLKSSWFGRYFDIIVRHEGEKPLQVMLENIHADKNLVDNVPGVVFCDEGVIMANASGSPLAPSELPVPDFGDLPLNEYLSPELTLPILSSRGCYWGKCEFCHHGMVYGDKYMPYKKNEVREMVETLSNRYGAKSFVFNDEAIPPKILRSIAQDFPDHEETGWTFQGLIKFEKIYKAEMWPQLYRAGFRRLSIGLESASERVLDLMKKHCTSEAIISNLTYGTEAGLQMHCFMFFGFPGETEEDAKITYDFILENSDIIGNFGASTFAYEHNAPISFHPDEFGVKVVNTEQDDLDVFYEYTVSEGVDQERAQYWSKKLRDEAYKNDKYRCRGWIMPEHMLFLLRNRNEEMLQEDLMAFEPFRKDVAREITERQWRYLDPKEIVSVVFG